MNWHPLSNTTQFVVIYAFFGVNFILQKFCSCKKNDKYQVWFRGTSLADRRVGLWLTSWKWWSRRLTFRTGDRWRRTIPTTDKLFCSNTENVSGRVQNGRPGKTTAGGDKHQGSAFLRSYLPLMLRTSHFTKQFYMFYTHCNLLLAQRLVI